MPFIKTFQSQHSIPIRNQSNSLPFSAIGDPFELLGAIERAWLRILSWGHQSICEQAIRRAFQSCNSTLRRYRNTVKKEVKIENYVKLGIVSSMVFCTSRDKVRTHALEDAHNKHNIWLLDVYDLITRSIQDQECLVNTLTRFNQLKI